MYGNRSDPRGVVARYRNVVGQRIRPEPRDTFDVLLFHDPAPLATDEAEHATNGDIAEVLGERRSNDVDLTEHPVDQFGAIAVVHLQPFIGTEQTSNVSHFDGADDVTNVRGLFVIGY